MYQQNMDHYQHLIDILKNRYKNIVFIILDGMGEHILEKAYIMLDYPEIQEYLIIPETLETRVVAF